MKRIRSYAAQCSFLCIIGAIATYAMSIYTILSAHEYYQHFNYYAGLQHDSFGYFQSAWILKIKYNKCVCSKVFMSYLYWTHLVLDTDWDHNSEHNSPNSLLKEKTINMINKSNIRYIK